MSESIDLVQLTDETKKLTAMVVEDEVSANEMLSSTFKSFFADVTSAFDGKQALEMAKKNKTDIIHFLAEHILDVCLVAPEILILFFLH